MKFSFSLSLALSLCSVAQAGELAEAGDLVQAGSPSQDSKPAESAPPVPATYEPEDKGYEVKTWADSFMVFSPEYGQGCEFVDVIGFYPKLKVADIQLAQNDQEPEHEDKMSLTEIYNALAKRRGADPDEIRMVAFSVEKEDTETDDLIARIREGRNVDVWGEVRIFPGDKEWDMILATEYYVKLLQVANRPVQSIIVRTRDHIDWWSNVVHTNRIFFSFGPLDKKTPVPGTTTELSTTADNQEVKDKKQEAEFIELLAEEDRNRDALQVEMAHQLADRALEAKKRA